MATCTGRHIGKYMNNTNTWEALSQWSVYNSTICLRSTSQGAASIVAITHTHTHSPSQGGGSNWGVFPRGHAPALHRAQTPSRLWWLQVHTWTIIQVIRALYGHWCTIVQTVRATSMWYCVCIYYLTYYTNNGHLPQEQQKSHYAVLHSSTVGMGQELQCQSGTPNEQLTCPLVLNKLTHCTSINSSTYTYFR